MTNRILLSALLWAVAAIGLWAQPTTESLDAVCRQALAAFQAPGFSVGVIKDGKVVLAQGYGVRTAGKPEKVDANTLFAIASNTKAFVSTALAVLQTEGKLRLDDPVRRHLPYFALYDPYVSERATVRDLLCHRLGLGTFSGDVIWYKSRLTPEEVVSQAQHLPAAYSFRAGYGYSNLMFIAAGEVIRAAAGQPWDQWVSERFFRPLGMTRTCTSVSQLGKMDNVATPHITRTGNAPIPYANWDNMGAAGGVISSANDMLRWIELQLGKGEFRGQRLFEAGVVQETWRPHNAFRRFSAYGLGWSLGEKAGMPVVSHGGGYDGMYSRVVMVPESNLGIVILTNSMTGLSGALSNYILDAYLATPDAQWLDKALTRERNGEKEWNDRRQQRLDARVLNTRPSLAPNDMVGVYHDPLYGNINIEQSAGGSFLLRFEVAPQLDARLSHWHYDTWKLEWEQTHAWFDFGTVQFVVDNNGKVLELRFDVPNDDIFFDEIHAKRQ